MSYTISVSKLQLDRIVAALRSLEHFFPGDMEARQIEMFDPNDIESENIRYLLGAAEDTLKEPESDDMIHGWNL